MQESDPRVEVVWESPVGPHVNYNGAASTSDVLAALPRGWTADFSNQVAIYTWFRSPIVQERCRSFGINPWTNGPCECSACTAEASNA